MSKKIPLVSSFLTPSKGELGVSPKPPNDCVWGGEWCLLCLSYIWFKWASQVIIGNCEIKMLIILWWRNIAIIESMLATSSDSLRSGKVMILLFGYQKEVVSITLAQSIFCRLIIDRIFSGNTSDRTKFISSVASELHKEGEQANFEVTGNLTTLTTVSMKSHSYPTKSDLVSAIYIITCNNEFRVAFVVKNVMGSLSCVKVEGFSLKLSQHILTWKLKFTWDFLAGTLTAYILT